MTCMMLFSVALFACNKQNTEKESPKETGKVENQSATPGAVSEFFLDNSFEQAEELVKKMTLEEKIGQMFLVAMPDEYDVVTEPKVSDKKLSKKKLKKLKKTLAKKQKKKLQAAVKKTQGMLKKYHVGGVYFTEKNVKNKKQTTDVVSKLQSCVSGSALYVAVEEEGGENHSLSADVKELETGAYMTPAELGKRLTVEHVEQKGAEIAEKLTEWGINLNLAPVADLAAGKVVSYDMRCYGSEAGVTSDLLTSMVKGMREGGLAVTLKHFPGFGEATGDYTEEILNNENSLMKLRNNEFSVYEKGIKAGADCVMVGSMSVSKITVKEIPAFLSEDIVTSILREELGFEGVVMTPPLNEGVITKNYTSEYVAVEAVKAGCDMVVMPANFEESYDALLAEVRSGRLDEKVINTAVCRILQNKIERGILVLEESDESLVDK